jgi:hypothetical protein
MSVFERERERQTERERKKKKNPPPFSIFFHANRYHFLQYTRLTSGLFLSSPVSDQINHVIFEYEKIRELKKSLFFPPFFRWRIYARGKTKKYCHHCQKTNVRA